MFIMPFLPLDNHINVYLPIASSVVPFRSLQQQRMSLGSSGIPHAGTESFALNNSHVFSKSTTWHGINDLSHKLKQELDRSIAKHLEKGNCL